METRKMTIHVTEDAYQVLEKYSGPRGRGQFISQLVMDYDRERMDGDLAMAALRERVMSGFERSTSEPSRKRRRK